MSLPSTLQKLAFQYRVNLTRLISYGQVVTTLKNGHHVESEHSVLKLNGKYKYKDTAHKYNQSYTSI